MKAMQGRNGSVSGDARKTNGRGDLAVYVDEVMCARGPQNIENRTRQRANSFGWAWAGREVQTLEAKPIHAGERVGDLAKPDCARRAHPRRPAGDVTRRAGANQNQKRDDRYRRVTLMPRQVDCAPVPRFSGQ